MNLTEQTVSGINEVSLQDSLNASLMKLKVTMGANAAAPEESDLLIFVDKESQENPTEESCSSQITNCLGSYDRFL